MKGYTTPHRVSSYIAKDFSPEEEAHCYEIIEAAETRIDNLIGQGWDATTVTDETHDIFGPYVRLSKNPATAITTATLKARFAVFEDTVLVAGQDYELDKTTNFLRLNPVLSIPAGAYLSVTYTVGAVVPSDIKFATTMLAAYWMQPVIDPNSFNVSRYVIGGDLELQFKNVKDGTIPQEVMEIVESYRTKYVGANRFWFA